MPFRGGGEGAGPCGAKGLFRKERVIMPTNI